MEGEGRRDLLGMSTSNSCASGSNHCQEDSTRCAMDMPHSATLFHTWEMEIISEAVAEVLKEILRFLQSHQEHYGVIIIIKKSQHKALLPIH